MGGWGNHWPKRQSRPPRIEPGVKPIREPILVARDPNPTPPEPVAAKLKSACGTGGTLKDGRIELQGDHLQDVETALKGLGYRTKRK